MSQILAETAELTSNLLIGGMSLIVIGTIISFCGTRLGFILGSVLAAGGILLICTPLGMEIISK